MAKNPAMPTITGTKVRQLDHGYWEPPQVKPIKKLVVLAMNKADPNQSTYCSRSMIGGRFACSLITNGTVTNPMPQKGKLM